MKDGFTKNKICGGGICRHADGQGTGVWLKTFGMHTYGFDSLQCEQCTAYAG